jgi:tRNA-specific 2-thiouridylase
MRIAVGFSGGVDSSVTVALLKKAGHDVIAVQFDQLGEGANDSTEAAAKKLGVPFEVLNLKEEFQAQVQKPFIEKLKEGKTPNPCILCNPTFKFGIFLQFVQEKFGAEKIATGHYCRSVDGKLMMPRDTEQDQTYFLSNLSSEQVSKIIFPLGEWTKEEVRKFAEEIGLPNAAKKSSTDVCFLKGGRFEKFVAEHVPQDPGDIIEKETNLIVGKHNGLAQYTMGQRKKLGIGGIKDRPEMPWFVAKKDFKKNELIVSQNPEDLHCFELQSHNFNWISGTAPAQEFDCEAKIRFRGKSIPCRVTANGKTISVQFKEPVQSIVPGQQVVLYEKELCLGGGEIA